jgi:hypothetical protein
MWLYKRFGLVIGFIEHFNIHNSWLHFTHHYHTKTSVLSHNFISRCSVTSSKIGRSSASQHTSSQAGGHLTLTSYSSNYSLMAAGPRHGPHRKHCFQQLLNCCVLHTRYLAMEVSLAAQFLLKEVFHSIKCNFPVCFLIPSADVIFMSDSWGGVKLESI